MPFLYNGEYGDDDYIDDPGGGDDIFYLMDHTLPEPYITYILYFSFLPDGGMDHMLALASLAVRDKIGTKKY